MKNRAKSAVAPETTKRVVVQIPEDGEPSPPIAVGTVHGSPIEAAISKDAAQLTLNESESGTKFLSRSGARAPQVPSTSTEQRSTLNESCDPR